MLDFGFDSSQVDPQVIQGLSNLSQGPIPSLGRSSPVPQEANGTQDPPKEEKEEETSWFPATPVLEVPNACSTRAGPSLNNSKQASGASPWQPRLLLGN